MLVCLTAVDRVVVLQFQQIKFGEVYLFNVYLRLPSNQTCLWAGHCSRESGGSIKAESQYFKFYLFIYYFLIAFIGWRQTGGTVGGGSDSYPASWPWITRSPAHPLSKLVPRIHLSD